MGAVFAPQNCVLPRGSDQVGLLPKVLGFEIIFVIVFDEAEETVVFGVCERLEKSVVQPKVHQGKSLMDARSNARVATTLD
jgi:hypothetical protein